MVAATLAASGRVGDLVVADANEAQAASVAAGLGHPGARAVGVDARDPAAVVGVLEGADVVVNCIGPFYRFGAPLLAAAIRAGIDYVDVCDDLDATREQLDLDGAARAAGVRAIIGMGNSPGFANVLVRYAADELLDDIHSVDIMHIHGGEPTEGPAVLKHRIHAMTSDVPLFIDGEFVHVRMLGPDGAAHVVTTDFPDVGTYPVYPYPHPETITLPRSFPGLRRVTNLGVVFPLSYFHLTQDLVRAGLASTGPLTVDGIGVVPLEFMVAHLVAERPRLLAEAGVTSAAGCLKIVVVGSRTDEPGDHTITFTLSSVSLGAGEGTGIPAALGALYLVDAADDIAPGVHPPEAVVEPLAMLASATDVLPRIQEASSSIDVAGGLSSVPLHLTHHHPDGTVDELGLG